MYLIAFRKRQITKQLCSIQGNTEGDIGGDEYVCLGISCFRRKYFVEETRLVEEGVELDTQEMHSVLEEGICVDVILIDNFADRRSDTGTEIYLILENKRVAAARPSTGETTLVLTFPLEHRRVGHALKSVVGDDLHLWSEFREELGVRLLQCLCESDSHSIE